MQSTCNGLQTTSVGTPGADDIQGMSGADVIAGLGGDDEISGLGGDDRLCGNAGKDLIYVQGGNDRVSAVDGAGAIWPTATRREPARGNTPLPRLPGVRGWPRRV